MVLARLFISLIAGLIALSFASRADAWEVCNETSFVLRVATATTIDGALTPKGWTRARPGQCLLFVADEVSPRYIYAESSMAHQGGIREWRGDNTLCASQENFTANTEVSCPLQDMQTRDYLSVDPAEKQTRFVEIDEFGKDANIAGAQRLLKDLGYTIPKIDGQSGRQTRRSLAKFIKDFELSASLTTDEKIDALEAAALEKREDIGVILCNSAQMTMWTALAYRQGASWEARGWWPIEPGICLRPHTQSIKGADAHIYALLESSDNGDDFILKSGTAVPAQFCIAQSRFSATNRENCADRGYRAASFRPLPSDKDGARLTLTEADFAAPTSGGLRR